MQKNNILIISISIIIAGLLIGGGIIISAHFNDIFRTSNSNSNNLNNTNSNNINNNGLSISDAPVLGNKNAPITLVEFADFQCPYCNAFFETSEKKIIDNYVKTGKVKLAFKTLTFIDSYNTKSSLKESFLAGLAGECAKEQGKFWSMHNAIFTAEGNEIKKGISNENSGNLNMKFFDNTAREIGLNVESFDKCIKSQKYAEQLDKYLNDAETAMPTGISTPSLFINGTLVTGARPFAVYKQIIDSKLKSISNSK